MKKKFSYTLFAFLLSGIININVLAADNLKEEKTNDLSTKEDKCPTSLVIQDNLKGSKDMNFSVLDCMYYQMDNNGNFILDEMGNKILRKETDGINYSCVQNFLDTYTNTEFAEAANNKVDEAFPKIKYCPIYCVEENEFVFPGYAPIANSGEHFTWTIGKTDEYNMLKGLTVSLHGTKVCRTNVNLDAFANDYADLMEDIEDSIDVTNPTSGGSSSCTPNANSGISTPRTYCGFATSPISTSYHVIEAADYQQFSNMHELKDFTGTAVGSILLGYLNIVPNNNSLEVVAGSHQDVAYETSNRYFITSVPSKINDTSLDGVIKFFDDGSAYIQEADVSNNNTAEEIYNAAVGPDIKTGEITIKVQVWERHCCNWIEDNTVSPERFYSLGTPGWNINSGIPPTINYGFDSIGNKVGCKLIDGQRDVDTTFYSKGNASQCCDGVNTQTHSEEECWGTWRKVGTSYKCDGYVHTNTWNTYSCKRNPDNYTYFQRYAVKCGTEGNGDVQAISAEAVSTKCTTSGIPSCPSGYSYSPNTGKCYYADFNRIETDLNKLLGIIKDIKQCHDVLQNYDYYLDTNIEIEYNKTQDSVNNVYLPSKDTSTQTQMVRVSENTEEDDGEDKLGKYSSPIVKPSSQSTYSKTVNFFGTDYTLSANGIPLVGCTLSGPQKTCTATNNTTLNDYWYDWYGKTYIAMYEYKLVDNFYKWVLLPNGVSQSTKPTGDYLKYGRFIDVGYANYPVHFNTVGAEYEGLNIRISNVGYKNYLYNTYKSNINSYNNQITDQYIAGTQNENNYEVLYDCYYKVDEGAPYCPSDGCNKDEYDLGAVRLIYRPISLENPFPAMSGNGRDTGNNWCTLNGEEEENCKNNETNENVKNYILNNRNTEGSSVYNKEPMYEITLNPSLIKKIREYNDNTNYDDYNLYCNQGTIDEDLQGRECRSHFIVGGMEETNLPTLSSYFKDTCGINNDFKACDKLDGYER